MKKRVPIWVIILGVALLAGGMVAVNVLGERASKSNVAVDDHDHDHDGAPDHAPGAH